MPLPLLLVTFARLPFIIVNCGGLWPMSASKIIGKCLSSSAVFTASSKVISYALCLIRLLPNTKPTAFSNQPASFSCHSARSTPSEVSSQLSRNHSIPSDLYFDTNSFTWSYFVPTKDVRMSRHPS